MRYLLFLAVSLYAFAPNLNPIAWTLRVEPAQLRLHASIAKDYKLFSPAKATPGPIPLKIRVIETDWVKLGKPVAAQNGDTLTGETDIVIPYHPRRKLAQEGVTIHLEIRYQSCSDQICLPPITRTLEAKLLPANPVL
jgi:hypothetical protein